MVAPTTKRFLLRLQFAGIASALAAGTAWADDLTVSAAASLSNAFGEIAKAFEAKHASDKVVLNFAASDVLLKQIEQGAPADVFASADEATMDRAAAGNLIDAASRKDFAGNTLVLIVSSGTKAPGALSDLASATYPHIAIGNPDSVPAGRYAKQALSDAGQWDKLQTQLVQTQNVRQALDYVARGEAQAGFVYATDAAIQKDKVSIALSVPTATPVRYPIAATKTSTHATLAREFVDFVASPTGEAVLGRYGFSSPK
jgi:molybdate transport system substrate-binding protein